MLPHFENVIDRFEIAWRAGRRPALTKFLGQWSAGASEAEMWTLASELVKVDLEYRWRAAQAAGHTAALRLEVYARRLPLLGPAAQLPLDLIAEEYRVRRRFGDAPVHQEYFARFTHRRADLAAALEAVDRELAEEGWLVAELPSRATKLVRRAIDPDAPLYHGDFVLKRQIGSGGLCRVYAGVQRSLSKEVAIKVLRRRYWNSADAVGCFLREARIVGQLPPKGIVAIHGLGRLPRGGYFMVMDLVDGLDLRARRNAAKISPAQAAQWVAAAAQVVQRVHAAGFVHADLKPANILVDYGGQVLLTDFGFARELGACAAPQRAEILGGTPAFLVPELAASAHPPAIPAIDVFGLGGILFWLLTGRAVHEESEAGELLASLALPSWDAKVGERILEPVPSGLVDLCRECLARNPDDRPELSELLTRCRL